MSNTTKRVLLGLVILAISLYFVFKSPLGDDVTTAVSDSSVGQYFDESSFSYPTLKWETKEAIATAETELEVPATATK